MRVGDRVRFIGDSSNYIVSAQRNLRRIGFVIQTEQTPSYRIREGQVRVRWVPKTSRGIPETYTHNIADLELIE